MVDSGLKSFGFETSMIGLALAEKGKAASPVAARDLWRKVRRDDFFMDEKIIQI